MNILIEHPGHRVTYRPDTTWEKNGGDFYPQDDISRLFFSPVLYARILKPGRSIVPRFAHRHYDSAGYGLLFYDGEKIEAGGLTSFSEASCIDRTSFLPYPAPEIPLGGVYRIECNGKEVFQGNGGSTTALEASLVHISSHIYLRTGDMVCLELSPAAFLAERSEGDLRIKGMLDGTPLFEFQVIV